MARNLITDVAGVRVGHADDAKLGSGVTVVLFDARGRGASTCAAAGRARARPRCSTRRMTVERHRRDRARRAAPPSASMPRPACRPGCASRAAASAIRDARGADRAGGDPVRPAQRRRQGLGPLSALPRARLCGGRRPPRRISRSAAPAPALAPRRRRSRAASARPRRMTARRHHRRRARRRQRRRHDRDRRRTAFLGGAVRAEQGIRRARLPPQPSPQADLALRAKGGPRENTTHCRHRHRRAA